MKKIVFELESDVLSCGINTEGNFLNGESYLSGSVIAAGFAKDIYLSCEIQNRNNLIEIKEPEGGCRNCQNRTICERFSNMRFSFFYKEGYIPAPMTTHKCKISPRQHPIKDIILDNGICVCDECRAKNPTSGRMEDLKGYINVADSRLGKVQMNTMTHTAINYYTHTALSGSLFTTVSIARGQRFTGYIDDCDTDLVDCGTVVYVGKYSSSGYGKLKVISVSESDEPSVCIDDIKHFTANYRRDKPESKDMSKYYVPLLFLSDAKLGFDFDVLSRTTDEYKELWKKKLFDDADFFEVENVYAQNRLYGGYDTSKAWGEWRKAPEIQTIKGTSILVSFPKNELRRAEGILNIMLRRGVGRDTSIGYGKIDVCNKVHMIGAMNNGN